MMLRLRILCALTFLSCIVSAQSKKKPAVVVPAIRWELVANDRYKPNQNLCAFTLVNNTKKMFPATGWTVYFSSSRDADPAQLCPDVHVEHVNGDIFRFMPTGSFKGLLPGDSIRVEYFSGGLLLNYTNAPSGLYIVFDNDPAKGYPVTDFKRGSLQHSTTGLMTAEKLYHKNETILDIPAGELPPIFPTPLLFFKRADLCALTQHTVIRTTQEFMYAARYFSHEMASVFGDTLRVNPADSSDVTIQILKNQAVAAEGYSLEISPGIIKIKTSTDAGAFYAFQSLRSLFPAAAWNGKQSSVAVQCYDVDDAPRFAYRSLMLDAARNFHSKAEILRILDLMAMYKLNVFHFHFIDDEGWRLEIPGLPELTEVGASRGFPLDSKNFLPSSYGSGPVAGNNAGSGYFTRNDFIEILRYANTRHIAVIPEVESPGHSRAAIKAMDARYTKYMAAGNRAEALRYLLRDTMDASIYSSAQQWTDNVMCVALPSVYDFIEKITTEIQSMYKEASAPLTTIHFGGDEVPAGVWTGSPVCNELLKKEPGLKGADDLWYYYYGKVNEILKKHGLFLSAWEEAGLRKTMLDGEKHMIPNPLFANENFQLNVWNNMVGWGSEDLPYRLANAGYKVVLSPVSNNYLDLAYYKSPDEPGYYWGGFQDIDKPFYFIPFDYYKNTVEDAAGEPVRKDNFIGKDRLTDFGRSNIVGIQGLLWSENLRSDDQLEYMLLPKLLGIAERAWAPDPSWAHENDSAKYQRSYNMAWSLFVNTVGKKEIPRLGFYKGGFLYRIPAPGVIKEDGLLKANTQLPGLVIRYTTDGSEPNAQSPVYGGPVADNGKVKFRCFDSKGRGGNVSAVSN